VVHAVKEEKEEEELLESATTVRHTETAVLIAIITQSMQRLLCRS